MSDSDGASRSEGGRARPWLTRNLVILTAVSFTQDMASELVYPLLPLLLTGVLAAPALVVGLVEGFAEAAAGISKYLAGRWSDRAAGGRKPFIAVGYGMAALGKVIVAAAWVWPVVLVGRVVDRLGKGVRSAPRDALLADSVPEESLGKAFGFHRMGDSLGAVVGPILALGLLAMVGGDVRAALWWAAIPAVLSVVLVLLAKERRSTEAERLEEATERPAGEDTEELAEESAWELAHDTGEDALAVGTATPAAESHHRPPLPTAFKEVATTLIVVAIVNFPDALLLLRLIDSGWSTTEVVAAYALFNLVYAASSFPAGVLADRLRPGLVYAIGLLAFAVGYGGLALLDGRDMVFGFICVAIYGLFPGLTDGVGKAWISALVPSSERGRAQGIYQSLQNGAVFLAGLWAGAMWTLGPGQGVVPLTVSAVLAVIAAGFLIRLPDTKKQVLPVG